MQPSPSIAVAMIEPDIAGNVGALLRTAACFGVTAHIVEPCGFPFGDRSFRRAGMDYAAQADIVRHISFGAFAAAMRRDARRLVLMTTEGACPLDNFAFSPADVIMLGSESRGASCAVHEVADARLRIPMRPGFRSLNVGVSGGIALAEALRQTQGFAR